MSDEEGDFLAAVVELAGANSSLGGRQQTADDASFMSSLFSHIDKQWNFAEVMLIIVISAILNLVTIVGNIMVLISFKMDRSLQTVSNYFLLSLALADLLIGLISMPLYTLYLLLNYWPLGPLMCDIWLAIDYLNSNAAVLNMLIISFDRYFSVTRPLTYRAKRTTKHACLMISCAWILSLTIWTPAIFTYPYYKGRTVQGTDKCEIEFVKANTYLTFVTAILAFYIPVIIMIYLYWRIWLETKKRYRDLTTLFLVSGVGAAAPARATRPLQHSASVAAASGVGGPASGAAGSLVGPSGASPLSAAVGQASGKRASVRLANSKAAANASAQLRLQQLDNQAARRRAAPFAPATPPATDTPTPPIESRPTPGDSRRQTSPGPAGALKCRCPCCPRNVARCCAGARTGKKPARGHHHHHAHHHHHHTPTATTSGPAPRCCPKSCGSPAAARQTSAGCCKCQSAPARCASCEPCLWYSSASGGPQQRSTSTRAASQSCGQGDERAAHKRQLSDCSSALAGRHCHHHHHHAHHHQHHHAHSAGNKFKCIPASKDKTASGGAGATSQSAPGGGPLSAGGAEQASSKLSLLAASYQQLAGCKVHPSSAAEKEPALEGGAGGVTKAAEEQQQQAALAQLAANISSTLGAEQEAAARTRGGPQSKGGGQLVDVATSPIQFPASPADETDEELLLARAPLAPEPFEDRDFETRIVSTGEKFRFESDDLSLPASPRAPGKEVCVRPKRAYGALSCAACKQCQQQQQRGARDCCAEALRAHDADCRLCNPLAPAGHLHRTHRATPAPSGADACRQCQRPRKGAHQKQAEEASEAADQLTNLPILSGLQEKSEEQQVAERALQKCASPDTSNCDSASPKQADEPKRTQKRAKKFSQKLTFSDILVEKSTTDGFGAQATTKPKRELSADEEASSGKRDSTLLQLPTVSQQEATRSLQGSPGDSISSTSQMGGNLRSGGNLQNASSSNSSNWIKRVLCPRALTRLHLTGRRQVEEPHNERGFLRNACCSFIFGLDGRQEQHKSPPARSSNDSVWLKARNSSSDEQLASKENHASNSSSATKPSSSSYSSHHPIQPKSERKAAKTLSTLLLVFIVTWLPYNILVLIKTLSGGEDQVPEKIWNFSYYLCYINSTINPLCYALCNAQFRRTYMRILQCKLSNEHSTRRLVPLQSSTTWNKDLRITGSDSNQTTQTSNNGNGYSKHHRS